ncbi:MAG: glycosyl hydrolase family 95 catalytic domain-containing protein, partial [Cellulosilyticaceae bacterium]
TGKMNLYETLFEGQVKVLSTNGTIQTGADSISIANADEVIMLLAVGTNYQLDPEVFREDDPKKKLQPIDPHHKVTQIIQQASKPYEALRREHLLDFQSLFGRVSLTLGDETDADKPTDELMRLYQERSIPYLEALYFQYGRYLLIACSRKGCLPANLQGVWNCHDASPWGSGYWHNINVQMNYWPAFNTNLIEMFEAYKDFFKAFLPKARDYADQYIGVHNTENLAPKGENGWTIGTGSYPYTISAPGGHSGPGTGGLTSKLFWEYYDFTRDKTILEETTYPALLEMAKFLTKTVKQYGTSYLTSFSASPEQMVNGAYKSGGAYYQTVGCAFDQQMIYENGKDLLKAAEQLGIKDEETLVTQKEQIDHYQPVLIGWSGQIKEYLEEHFYGEIGEYRHRHISQLIGLYPGTVVNSETEAWMDAAKYTLNERGDDSTGWALAHRINARARTGEGNRCYQLLRELLMHKTMVNLWDTHPPFQIDGNFGATAGIAEMLVQSHEEAIHILPALPDVWAQGEVSGLTARGAFEIAIKWENKSAKVIQVLSKKGEQLKLHYPNLSKAKLKNQGISFEVCDKNQITMPTEPMITYSFELTEPVVQVESPTDLVINNLTLTWQGPHQATYTIYRSVNSETNYTKIAEGINVHTYTDDIAWDSYETATYKVTACVGDNESKGIYQTINHATPLEKDIYRNQLKGRKQF